MLDPEVISIGGGLSKAFDCFKNTMNSALKENSLSFKINNIVIAPSKVRELSTMIGAAMLVKRNKTK